MAEPPLQLLAEKNIAALVFAKLTVTTELVSTAPSSTSFRVTVVPVQTPALRTGRDITTLVAGNAATVIFKVPVVRAPELSALKTGVLPALAL